MASRLKWLPFIWLELFSLERGGFLLFLALVIQTKFKSQITRDWNDDATSKDFAIRLNFCMICKRVTDYANR